MVEPLAATFRRPFYEAVAALELRLANPVATSRHDDLVRSQHDRSLMIAGATKADLLTDFGAALRKARAEGTGLEEFARDWRQIVEKHGWHGWTGEGTKKGEAWRIRIVFETNMRTSYMAGRLAQLRDGKYPYWVYKHGGSVEPRLQHLGWDGLVLPSDHPFWVTHFPPNGWGCSCEVFGALSLDHARRKGGDPTKTLAPGWDVADPRTGAPPGIDKNWDYAPGSTVSDTVSFAARKIAALPPEIGADYGTSIASMIQTAWPTWVADTLLRGTHRPGLVGVMSRDVIAALDARGLTPRSAEIFAQPGLLSGKKATRHEAKGDALSPSDWISLPWAMQHPTAVLRDEETGRLIYILAQDATGSQIAVAMDYFLAGPGLSQTLANAMVSAYRVRLADLRGRLKGGKLTLLVGSLG